MVQTFAVYVEKELVGKRIKSSKVRVVWQFAFNDDFVVHQVELRHSIVSGKREIMYDNQVVYANKALFQGTFEHRSPLSGHDVRVTVEDTFEGYLYDLIVDNVAFHRMPRKTLSDLETLRNEKREALAPTIKADFATFTGKSKSALDGSGTPTSSSSAASSGETKKEKQPSKKIEEPSLIDLDWDAAVTVSRIPPPTQSSQYNPFDAPFGQNTTVNYSYSQAPAQNYDPFAAAPTHMLNTTYSAPHSSNAINTSYYPSQQQQYASQPALAQAYDPFAMYHQSQHPQPVYQPPQQQPVAYDPFS